MRIDNKQDTSAQQLTAQLQTLISSSSNQQSYYLLSGCGHVTQAPGRFEASAPIMQCPECQKNVNDHTYFNALAVTTAISNALQTHETALLLQRLTHIQQYFYKHEPEQAVRSSDGRLFHISQKKHYPGMFIDLTPADQHFLIASKTLINTLIHTLKETHDVVLGIPVQPIRDADVLAAQHYRRPENIPTSLKQAIFRELAMYNRDANSSEDIRSKSRTHRRMIRALRQINESTATVYAQSAHEQIRGRSINPKEVEKNACFKACQTHSDIISHCAISLDDFPEEAVYTNCGHVFDKEAITDWLADNNDCPCCRQDVNTLVEIPLRSAINHALRDEATPRSLHNLQELIRPYHVNWPFIVTKALRNPKELNARVVWSKTPNARMDLTRILPHMNRCIEAISHTMRGWTHAQTHRTSAVSVFNQRHAVKKIKAPSHHLSA